jgi:hypothetical protein
MSVELAIDAPGEVAVPHRFNDSAGHAFPHAVVASVHRPGSNDYQLDREPEYSAPPRHFRVQPWPARWGFETERELEKKLNALPPFGDDSDLDRRVPAEYDHEDMQEVQFTNPSDHFDRPFFGLHRLVMERKLGIDLWEEPSWRRLMRPYCEGDDDMDEDEEEDAFLNLKHDMDENEEWGFEDERYPALRLLVTWAMEHRLDGIAALLDADMLHVGSRLFPWETAHSHSLGGKSRSLIAIAALDMCSPAAVDMLLSRGADPEAEMCPRGDDPTYGPGSLARCDRQGNWDGKDDDKMAILRSLCRAGADAYLPMEEYEYGDRRFYKEELQACRKLFCEQCDHREQDMRVRLGNVVAVLGIISFWRRVAYAPGSIAARAAVERLNMSV